LLKTTSSRSHSNLSKGQTKPFSLATLSLIYVISLGPLPSLVGSSQGHTYTSQGT